MKSVANNAAVLEWTKPSQSRHKPSCRFYKESCSQTEQQQLKGMLRSYCELSHISEAESLEAQCHWKSSGSAVAGERHCAVSQTNCFGMTYRKVFFCQSQLEMGQTSNEWTTGMFLFLGKASNIFLSHPSIIRCQATLIYVVCLGRQIV